MFKWPDRLYIGVKSQLIFKLFSKTFKHCLHAELNQEGSKLSKHKVWVSIVFFFIPYSPIYKLQSIKVHWTNMLIQLLQSITIYLVQIVTGQLNLNSSWEWKSNQLDHPLHPKPPTPPTNTHLNVWGTSRQLRQLISGMQPYFDQTRWNSWTTPDTHKAKLNASLIWLGQKVTESECLICIDSARLQLRAESEYKWYNPRWF